jgi:hypothetical protein
MAQAFENYDANLRLRCSLGRPIQTQPESDTSAPQFFRFSHLRLVAFCCRYSRQPKLL